MTALAANYSRRAKMVDLQILAVPANAGDVFYAGAYACRESATGLATPGADAATLWPLGVVMMPKHPDDPDLSTDHALDNTDGADGTLTGDKTGQAVRCIEVAQNGEWAFAVSAGTARVGLPAYLVDDNTVSANATTHGVIAGRFTRQSASGVWYVDIAWRGIVGALAGAHPATVAALATALTDSSGGTDDGTISAVGATNSGDVSGVINNNFSELHTGLADVRTTVAALRTALIATGVIKSA